MRILYLGSRYPHSTCAHRAEALRRLGHTVIHLDPQDAIPSSRWLQSFNIRTGYCLFEARARHQILRVIGREPFDLAWINAGAQLGPAFYKELAARNVRIINYNNDDPFGDNDHRKWNLYKRAVPYHDATVVVRRENISEALARGAKKVLRVFMSYDPVAHAPAPVSEQENQRFGSEVVFVGSWMPERGPFMARLLQLGVPVSIWGEHGTKPPNGTCCGMRCVGTGPTVATT